MNKKCFVLRGCSGAGKSTLALELARGDENKVFEADKYLCENGEYIWSPERVSNAHVFCYLAFNDALIDGKTPLVVSNTNTSEREFQRYIDLARDFGYQVFSLVVENRADTKDIHNVPEDTLKKQEQRIRSSLKLR